jgi:hypothetical protein
MLLPLKSLGECEQGTQTAAAFVIVKAPRKRAVIVFVKERQTVSIKSKKCHFWFLASIDISSGLQIFVRGKISRAR